MSITDQAGDVISQQTKSAIKGIILKISKPTDRGQKSKTLTSKDVNEAAKRTYKKSFKNTPKGTVISLKQLKQLSVSEKTTLEKLDESITRDVMKHFHGYCKTLNVQYSILKEKAGSKDRYYIFFKGNDASSIKKCIELGIKDYMKEAQNPKKERASVLDKLRKNLEFIKERDSKALEEGKEKNMHLSDRVR